MAQDPFIDTPSISASVESFQGTRRNKREDKRKSFEAAVELIKRLSPKSQTIALRNLILRAQSDPDLKDTAGGFDPAQMEVAPTLENIQGELAEETVGGLTPERRGQLGESLLGGQFGSGVRTQQAANKRAALQVAATQVQNELNQGELEPREGETLADAVKRRTIELFNEYSGLIGVGTEDSDEPLTSFDQVGESLVDGGASSMGVPPAAPASTAPAPRVRPAGMARESPIARGLEAAKGFATSQRAEPITRNVDVLASRAPGPFGQEGALRGPLRPRVGDTIVKKGRRWVVKGYDEDGTPLVDPAP